MYYSDGNCGKLELGCRFLFCDLCCHYFVQILRFRLYILEGFSVKTGIYAQLVMDSLQKIYIKNNYFFIKNFI